MGKRKTGPFSGQRIESTSKRHTFPTYFIIHRISTSNETFHNVSPFLVEKGITSSVGEVKSTKKLRSGDLLVEVESPKQAKQIAKLNSLSTIPVTVNPRATQTPSPGNSYVSVAKKSISAPSADSNKDISTVSISKPSDSTARALPPITNLPISASPSVVPASAEALASPDFTDFKLVTNRKKLKKDSPTKTNNSIAKAEKISKFYTSSRREVLNTVPTKDNICTHQSALKPFETKKPTCVDTQLLPMAVLPPLEKIVLQFRESDADAEMSSSSLSEEDALEYDMSEDLEDSPAVNSPLPSSKPQKGDKYKNR
ncbi:hypothetical protein AVEN_18931-1 [Araneus ventricosus]|uniref:Uncharacterized protein n=1 Tax=Araneus ventricosus TaxID=182803 RepID=A0A4Y2QP85_ARAVE|nr:hypothetical protein AVEN_18931-1 [Araneus ventricosus]